MFTLESQQESQTNEARRASAGASHGISLLWGRQMSGGDDRSWPAQTPKGGSDGIFSTSATFGLVPLSGTAAAIAERTSSSPPHSTKQMSLSQGGLMGPSGPPLFPLAALPSGEAMVPRQLPLGMLGTSSMFPPSHALPEILPLSEAELLAVESSRPWEREDTLHLNELPTEFQFAASEASNVTLGPFKELAVMYVNSRLPLETRLHKTVANRILLTTADQVGLKNLVFRLHLQNSERLPTPESMVLFIRMRATQKLRSEQKKLERSERINLHSNSSSGHIEYFDGIDLVIGRERDSIIRPMLNRYFRTHRQQCRAALDSVGLRLQDLRSWTGVELCKALWTLSRHVDDAIWHTAVHLHQQKVVRRRSHLRR